ncbi:hypothetical protein H2202_009434 [Exophiala xenobiotica]|nr:hypothetical protein H2202_009434 [Exophiala xenobiotica]KAK5212047.1 hypothetical protein LTR41_002289 [Exophiala xenobiotica]KAK5235139.1 hypothetical protein LTR47_003975 [Exophiala xenobiotica]KAK5254420.1 hypothetical protein LTS06_001254 [Exophiala xenobiotica]KAK5347620.1 hypothetical protein LTR61_008577 [Exophiala xenobiotica]
MNSEAASVVVGSRTRTNVRQSKYGCYTCKIRRVKCDETKPSCLRCSKSKLPRQCGGYPVGAPSGPDGSNQNLASPWGGFMEPGKGISLVAAGGRDHDKDRFQALACTVLANGFVGTKTAPEAAFWKYLLPQLTWSIASVREAASALGASYEHQILRRQCGVSKLTVLKQISSTMRKLQEDIVRLPHGPLPVLVACVLLACAETIQHRNTDALLHLRGAFAAMSVMQGLRSGCDVNTGFQDDNTSYIFRKLDLQVTTYAQGMAPELSLANVDSPMCAANDVFTMPTADRILFQTLHLCYDFAPQATLYKYKQYDPNRESLIAEQGRHIANLTAWMSWYQECYRSFGQTVSDSDRLRGLVLQAHCLSALIYVSTILDPYEVAYDKYAPRFQQIVQLVEETLEANKHDTNLPMFSPEMGVIPPLFLTAMNYREPRWRSKAISLLRRCGQEGPWCGYIEAAVAEAVVRAEEEAHLTSARTSTDVPGLSHDIAAQAIPEKDRIAGCTILDIIEGVNGSKKAVIELTRCKDMERLLECNSGLSPRDDSAHWLMWREEVDLVVN